MLRVSKRESLVGENHAAILLKPLLLGPKYVVTIAPRRQNPEEMALNVQIVKPHSPIICTIYARKVEGESRYDKTYLFVVGKMFTEKLASEVFRKTADFLRGKHELHEALVRSAIPESR